MKLNFSTLALYVLHQLAKAGFEAYIVGGAVRDLIGESLGPTQAKGAQVIDYDLATNATPEEILKVFPDSFYENEFGTVMITDHDLRQQVDLVLPSVSADLTPADHNSGSKIIDLAKARKVHSSLHKQAELAARRAVELAPTVIRPNFEITTYRSKEIYANFRHPAQLEWGKTIQEDLARRDFTINALAVGVTPAKLTQLFDHGAPTKASQELNEGEYQLIDRFQGLADLKQQLIRAVGDPRVRFQEDALRLLRAIRFSVELGFAIEPATMAAITTNAKLLSQISQERVRDELLKMLGSAQPARAITLLDESGLLTQIIPELAATKGVEQGGHHTTDVWTHSLDALASCPSPDPIVRLSTLLHDISKPQTYHKQPDGKITFYSHEVIGSRVAKQIAKRLKLSKHDQDRIFGLVRYHMFHYQPHNSDASIRRFMRKVGLENIDDILDVREGDRLGSGARKTSWRLEEMKERIIEQLNQPLEISDLAISGHDLMAELRLKPGPIIGQLLHQLFEVVLETPDQNIKDTLLEQARRIIAENETQST